MNPIGLLIIAVLPILILVDSKKRIKKFSWEWAVIGYLAMSTYMVLLYDIIFPKWFTGNTFFAAWLRGAVGLLGPLVFWGIYTAVENPIRTTGKKWDNIRSISALFVLVVTIGGYILNLKGYELELGGFVIKLGWLLITGSLGFIIGQIGMLPHIENVRNGGVRR